MRKTLNRGNEEKGKLTSHRYKTEFAPAAFMASLKTWESRFNANVQFIDKQYAGYYIYSTFCYFCREILK